MVISKSAEKALKMYDVPVVCLDDSPNLFLHFDRSVKKTIDYLNKHAKVVLFYELFGYSRFARIKSPTTIFLTHGNMLKSYMTMNPKRLKIMKDYDYMVALSPHLKKEFIEENGIDPKKLIDYGIARTDEVIRYKGKIHGRSKIASILGLDPNLPMLSYMPTYWGASSVHHIGREMIRHLPDDYTLIFRPHPQTPGYIIDTYLSIIKRRPNVRYAPDGFNRDIDMLSLFNASSAIIGDVSSVMLEAILVDKPLIFAGVTGREELESKDLSSIKELVDYSTRLNVNNIAYLKNLLESALIRDIDPDIWHATKERVFFHYDGTSVDSISSFIKSKL